MKSGIFCNMPQHYAYPSPWDRYYYFRPYQYFQVTQLQQTVAGWGQDPKNISDNRPFQAIYDEVDPQPDAAPAAPRPTTEPVPAPAPEPLQAKPIDHDRQKPTADEPKWKFTDIEPGHDSAGDPPPRTAARVVRSTARTARISAPPPEPPEPTQPVGSNVELIRFVVP